ncbi:MAG: hypothetical protein ABIC40_08360 [bacterium]
MSKCIHADYCELYIGKTHSETITLSESLKEMYCHEDFKQCARFHAYSALGVDGVPSDLLPSQIQRAGELIAKAGKEFPE